MGNRTGLLIAMVVLASPAVVAQTAGTLTGTVIDEDGKPAAGASVKVLNTQPVKGAVVRSNGTYLIKAVPAGEYEIVAKGVGTSVTHTICIESGEETREDFRLTNVVIHSICLGLAPAETRKQSVDIGTSATIHTSNSDRSSVTACERSMVQVRIDRRRK